MKSRLKQFLLKKEDGSGTVGGALDVARQAAEEETPAEKKSRMISIWLIHTQMFIYALSFSIINLREPIARFVNIFTSTKNIRMNLSFKSTEKKEP